MYVFVSIFSKWINDRFWAVENRKSVFTLDFLDLQALFGR